MSPNGCPVFWVGMKRETRSRKSSLVLAVLHIASGRFYFPRSVPELKDVVDILCSPPLDFLPQAEEEYPSFRVENREMALEDDDDALAVREGFSGAVLVPGSLELAALKIESRRSVPEEWEEDAVGRASVSDDIDEAAELIPGPDSFDPDAEEDCGEEAGELPVFQRENFSLDINRVPRALRREHQLFSFLEADNAFTLLPFVRQAIGAEDEDAAVFKGPADPGVVDDGLEEWEKYLSPTRA